MRVYEEQPEDENVAVERLKACGFSVEYEDSPSGDLWTLCREGYGTVWNTDDNNFYWCLFESALSKGWQLLMDPTQIVFRIAQKTDGMSGRSLKNLVMRAVKEATKRALNDLERKVQLRELDFLDQIRK